jgi:short-subunit dehydrogenase
MKSIGKVIVVTGAGAGMGRQVALELLKRGASVAGVDINQSALDETVKLAGSNSSKISTYVVDISNQSEVAALPAKVIAQFGQVDGVINVAGIIHKFKGVAELSYEDFHRIFGVNFYGTVHMVKEFLPHLLKRSEAQILNVSSMGGYVPVPGQTVYGASKAAIKLFTEGLRSELKGTSVGVALLFPGAVNTNISINSGAMTAAEAEKMAAAAPKKMKTTDQVVAGKLIVDAFEKNSFHAFVGSDAKTMDRLSRIAPERAANLIQKQMASLIK